MARTPHPGVAPERLRPADAAKCARCKAAQTGAPEFRRLSRGHLGPEASPSKCYDLPVHVDLYRRGIQLFNERNFFDAHEAWEDVWRETNGREKKFLQGLIQVAVAFHHHSTGNVVGACSLFERARKNLIAYPETFHGISITTLTESVAAWRHSLIAGTSLPAFPHIDEGE